LADENDYQCYPGSIPGGTGLAVIRLVAASLAGGRAGMVLDLRRTRGRCLAVVSRLLAVAPMKTYELQGLLEIFNKGKEPKNVVVQITTKEGCVLEFPIENTVCKLTMDRQVESYVIRVTESPGFS
jgi:hypothetical protein